MTARLLTETEAARHCGMGVGLFRRSVRVHVPPLPLGEGVMRWDLKALDLWLDGLSGLAPDAPETAEGAYAARRERKRGHGEAQRRA